MKMTIFLLSFLLLFRSLNPSELPTISFKEASSKAFAEIQQHLIHFYSEQLFDAGLFEDLGTAIEAATIEWNQDLIDNPNRELYCYHLMSKDCSTRYGYLVYSINDRTAYLNAIYLEKAYRGVGLGKEILQELEVDLKKRDVEVVKLYVFAQNIAAFTLYERMRYSIEITYSDGDKPIGYHMKKDMQK